MCVCKIHYVYEYTGIYDKRRKNLKKAVCCIYEEQFILKIYKRFLKIYFLFEKQSPFTNNNRRVIAIQLFMSKMVFNLKFENLRFTAQWLH